MRSALLFCGNQPRQCFQCYGPPLLLYFPLALSCISFWDCSRILSLRRSQMTAREQIKPLDFFERLVLPLLKVTSRGLKRDHLHRRLIATERLRDHRQAERELKKQLNKE